MHYRNKWNENMCMTPIRFVVIEKAKQVLLFNATYHLFNENQRNADIKEVPRSNCIGHGAKGIVEENLRSNREVKPARVGRMPQKTRRNAEKEERTNIYL